MSSFNVVIATAGRKTLKRAVESILPQLSEEDFITVIYDGCPVDDRLFNQAKCTVNLYHEPKALGHWGHGARNKYQDNLPGDYILNGDDDDIWTPDAMKKIREHCTEKKLYIFQFSFNGCGFPMTPGYLGRGKCGTPNGVYANIGSFPEWATVYGGDGDFYEKLAKRIEPEWVKKIIYIVRPKRGEELTNLAPLTCEKCKCASFYNEPRTGFIIFNCRRCGHGHKVMKKC